MSHICITCLKPSTKKCGGCKQVSYCGQLCARRHWQNGHNIECRNPLINGLAKSDKILSRRKKYNHIWDKWGLKFKNQNASVTLTSDEIAMLSNQTIIFNLEFLNTQIEWRSPASYDAWKSRGRNQMRAILEDSFEKRVLDLFPGFVSENNTQLVFTMTIPIAKGMVILNFPSNEINLKLIIEYLKRARFWKTTSYSPYYNKGAIKVKIIVMPGIIGKPVIKANFYDDYIPMTQSELEAAFSDIVSTLKTKYPGNWVIDSVLTLKNAGLENTKNVIDKLVKLEYYVKEMWVDAIYGTEEIAETKQEFNFIAERTIEIIQKDFGKQTTLLYGLLNVSTVFIQTWKDYWSTLDNNTVRGYQDAIKLFRVWKDNSAYKLINGLVFGQLTIDSDEFRFKKYSDAEYSWNWTTDIAQDIQTFILEDVSYPRAKESFLVCRGFWTWDTSDDGIQRGPNFKLLKPGDIIVNQGFLATSYTEPPKQFYGDRCCILLIEVPVGYPCVVIQSNTGVFVAEHENEVLFPANTEMEFVNFETISLNNSLIETGRFKMTNVVPKKELIFK